MTMNDWDDSGYTKCPYCGYLDPIEVGMGSFHECDGTIMERLHLEVQHEKREQQNKQIKKKRHDDAMFLMRSGLVDYNDAYFMAGEPVDENDNYGGTF